MNSIVATVETHAPLNFRSNFGVVTHCSVDEALKVFDNIPIAYVLDMVVKIFGNVIEDEKWSAVEYS